MRQNCKMPKMPVGKMKNETSGASTIEPRGWVRGIQELFQRTRWPQAQSHILE